MNIHTLLQSMEYPGRFIILASLQEKFIAIYGVTARNISSKAKRYVYHPEKNFVTVEATDPEIMAQGDLDLLQYNPVYFFEHGIVIGNGRQTDAIEYLYAPNASSQLAKDLENQSFEADKYSTPRITGCFLKNKEEISAAFHIIRANEHGEAVRDVYPITVEPGKGKFISTYNGPNTRPTPSFMGEPVLVDLEVDSLEDCIQILYDALSPQPGKDDLRVSIVGVLLSSDLQTKSVHIINSVDQV